MSLRMLAAFAAALILPASAQASNTWFVAKSGSNANTCADSSHPCLTIGGAVTKAATGDTINIAAGTYSESVNAAGKVLSFDGAGPDAATGTIVNGHGSGSAFILSNGGQLHDLRATEDSAATVSVSSAGGSQAFTVTNSVIVADGFQSAIDAETAGGSLAVAISDSTLQQVQTSSGGAEYGLLMEGSIGALLTRVTASSVQNSAVAGSLGVNISAADSAFTGATGLADNNATLHVYRCRITGTVDEGIYVSA